jgi:hypothetical protein
VSIESSQAEIGAYLESELVSYRDGVLPTPALMEKYLTLAGRLPAIRSFELGPNYPRILLALQDLAERLRTALASVSSGDAERCDAAKIVHSRDAA